MGGSSSSQVQYSVPVTEKKQGETAIYRNPKAVKELTSFYNADIKSIQSTIEYSCKQFKDKQFVGQRDPISNEYVYRTYGEEYNDAISIGSAILNNKLQNYQVDREVKINVIGIFSKNRSEWNQVDMACALYGITSIPLYDTLTAEQISYVFQNSGITSLFCSSASLSTVLKTDLLKEGAANNQELPNNVTGDSIFTFSYTSGTTGNPKGAMITHTNLLAVIGSMGEASMNKDDVQLCYLPLPHIFQRIVNVCCWESGCVIAFYNGDILKLKQDIQDVRPTLFFSVPRLFNRFYDAINDQFKQLTGIKKLLVNQGLQTKLNNLREYCEYTHAIYDKLVFQKIKDAFGGRIRYCLTGSAPIQKDVLDFFKVVFGCPFYEAYGQTEGNGLEFLTSKFDKDSPGKVGGIVEHLEMKLVDVPEMNYLSTDKDQSGNPMPRGEICVRGNGVILGYFRDYEKTKEAIDDEKWLHSGDIGCLLQNGALKVIDRKKNIFKLSQGEYVAPERVENIYTRSRGVMESFVYGDSLQNYCVGVIVINPEEIQKIAAELSIQQEDIEKLCQEPQIIKFYQKILLDDGKKKGLHTFEIPQKIFLEAKPFALSGLCTASLKLQRFLAKEFYKQTIIQLYSK